MLEQRAAVRHTWAMLAPAPERFAERFLARLVERDAGLRVPLAAAGARAPARLGEVIGRIVELLDAPERLVRLFIELGHDLARAGIGPRDHDAARRALFETLYELLGDEFTADMDEAWHELYAVASAVVLRAGSPAG